MQLSRSHLAADQTPADAAFEAYLLDAVALGPHPVVVIEGGYFDLRYPNANDRMEHLRDSFQLLERLTDPELPVRPKVLLVALVNNFRAERHCGIDGLDCELPPEARPEGGPVHINDLPAPARAIYAEHATPQVHGSRLNDPHVRVFTMTTTRNRAAHRIHKALSQRSDGSQADVTMGPPDQSGSCDVECTTPDGEHVRVATCEHDDHVIAVRCAGLMAQHYYDLYLHAAQHSEPISSLWIFDFNRFTERERVRRGAIASFAMYPWPKALIARVVNCVYFPEDADGDAVQLTARPLDQ